MNVLVLNEQQNQLQTVDIDVIKSVTGKFEASEIVEMFKDFFYNKMILDVTALKDYDDPNTYKIIANGLNPDKVIFYLPEGSDLCTSGFLSRIINYGIYNFTTNLDGVKYLVNKSNTYKDVENIVKMAETSRQQNDTTILEEKNPNNNQKNNIQGYQGVNIGRQQIIIGFKNVTTNAGATSLIYMLKKELVHVYGPKIVAIELDKTDFLSFGDKMMISTTSNEIKNVLQKLTSASIILIDLNNTLITDLCTSTIYLIEPSTIKLNSLIRRNRSVIGTLKDKKVILNKSLLTQKEIAEFEYESGLSILYNIPPLNDRKRNEIIADFLRKINLLEKESNNNGAGRIFGLFRK